MNTKLIPTLTVANLAQKIIFLKEMQKQISEGYWKDAKPANHATFWSQLDWDTVIVDPDSIGTTNIPAREKRDYNFSSKALLNIIGDRIRTVIAINTSTENSLLEVRQNIDRIYPLSQLRQDCFNLKEAFHTQKKETV